jgi:hypothetical protein
VRSVSDQEGLGKFNEVTRLSDMSFDAGLPFFQETSSYLSVSYPDSSHLCWFLSIAVLLADSQMLRLVQHRPKRRRAADFTKHEHTLDRQFNRISSRGRKTQLPYPQQILSILVEESIRRSAGCRERPRRG